MNEPIKYCPHCAHRLKRMRIGNLRRFVCPQCKWINYENPLPAVVALIKNDKNEILLVRRGVEPHTGKWALPAGFVEVEETPQQAVLRELKEETDLRGKLLGLIGVYSQKSKLYKRVLVIAYMVKVHPRGEPKAGDDTTEVKFFSLNDLPPIPFMSHREIIKMAIK